MLKQLDGGNFHLLSIHICEHACHGQTLENTHDDSGQGKRIILSRMFFFSLQALQRLSQLAQKLHSRTIFGTVRFWLRQLHFNESEEIALFSADAQSPFDKILNATWFF